MRSALLLCCLILTSARLLCSVHAVQPYHLNGMTCHRYDAQCRRQSGPTRTAFRAPKTPARLRSGVIIAKPLFAQVDGLHVMLLRNSSTQCRYIVQQGKDDGLGAQVHRKITTLAYALARGLLYVHEPFTAMEHVSGEGGFLEEAEAFFNLGQGELRWEDVPPDTTVCTVQMCKHTDNLHVVRPMLIRRYWHAPIRKPDPIHIDGAPFSAAGPPGAGGGRLTLVAHIRRGDVYATSPGRLVHNEYYVRTLGGIVRALPADLASRLVIVLYTDGTPSEVREITDAFPEAVLRSGASGSPLAPFHEFVTSDVLVMGKSSFSWSAAYFCTGVVVYGHPVDEHVPGWLDVRDDVNGSRLRGFFQDTGTHMFLRNRLRQRMFM